MHHVAFLLLTLAPPSMQTNVYHQRKRSTFTIHTMHPGSKMRGRTPQIGGQPIRALGGPAMGEHSEAFVACNVAKKKQAVAIAERGGTRSPVSR